MSRRNGKTEKGILTKSLKIQKVKYKVRWWKISCSINKHHKESKKFEDWQRPRKSRTFDLEALLIIYEETCFIWGLSRTKRYLSRRFRKLLLSQRPVLYRWVSESDWTTLWVFRRWYGLFFDLALYWRCMETLLSWWEHSSQPSWDGTLLFEQ